MRRIIIIGVLVVITITAAVFGLTFTNKPPAPIEPTVVMKEAALQAILRKKPIFEDDGRPVIEIHTLSIPMKGWYVATIKSVNDEKMSVPVTVVLTDSESADGALEVALGPEAYFTEKDIASTSLPDSIKSDLRK